eukprot:COSAG06_NODE_9490_length_1888_cov_1.271660_1_plen_180_part_10
MDQFEPEAATMDTVAAPGTAEKVCGPLDKLCMPIERVLYRQDTLRAATGRAATAFACRRLSRWNSVRQPTSILHPNVVASGPGDMRVRFCDLDFEDHDANKGTYGTTELTLDLLTGLFFTLGSLSVYNEDKSAATVAVLRLGLLLPFARLYHYLSLYTGQGDWCNMVTENCHTLAHCVEG